MKFTEVMAALERMGSATTKRVLAKHGAREPFFGVKIGDLKPLARQLKGRQELALALYDTGNGDAQYLAGMIADGRQMSKAQLNRWAKLASWDMISGTIVPWVASEHPEGFELAVKWTEARSPQTARAGWSTVAALVTTVPDEVLPVAGLARLLDRVREEIHGEADEVRYQMNNFVIACGTYAAPLARRAVGTARAMGRVEVDRGDTACRVPDAETQIRNGRRGAAVAPKRRTVRC